MQEVANFWWLQNVTSKCLIPLETGYNRDFLEQAHKSYSSHKYEILTSNLCASFYCNQTFEPKKIADWIEQKVVDGETAICPKCGIEPVLGSQLPTNNF